jgi:predicted anti-sigma-YlaC factor YlaD
MSPRDAAACARESELLAALGRGFLDADLLAHLESCAACRELRLVAGALLEDRVATAAAAPVPGGGTMWWRMQVRHRQEARAAARRALLVGQALTVAVAAALLIALFGARVAQTVRQAAAAVPLDHPLLLAIAVVLLAAPFGGWLAVRQK